MNAEQLLAGVIQQFSHRAACLRELVQNAIDADTDRIDVWFDERDGFHRVAVEDYGCGMTLEHIDSYLLNVFRSSKEGDLEYIGRFGIGFVSVFAMEPEFVTVETSRDDEHTRIVIGKDLSIRYFKGEPRVGTCVSLYLSPETYPPGKERGAKAFAALTAEGIAYLKHSCRYIDVELAVQRIDDGGEHEEILNVPFELDLPLMASYSQDGTDIRAGYGAPPHYTLMNRRLVLEEGRRALVPGAVVLASSRDIEHNLARNAVIQDEHFERFMGRLSNLVERELFPQLLERARARQGGRATVTAVAAILGDRSPSAMRRPYRALSDVELFPILDEGRLGQFNLREALERIPVVASEESPLAKAVSVSQPVLISTDEWPIEAVLEAIGGEGLPSLDAYSHLAPATGPDAERLAALPLSNPLSAVGLSATFSRLLGRDAGRLAVRVDAEETFWQGDAPGGSIVAINVRHRLIKRAATLAEHRPALATQIILRALEGLGVIEARPADLALDLWLSEAP